MKYLAAYDIADERRLKQIAGILNRYGLRIEKSVFSCNLTAGEYRQMSEEVKGKLKKGDLFFVWHLPETVTLDVLSTPKPSFLHQKRVL